MQLHLITIIVLLSHFHCFGLKDVSNEILSTVENNLQSLLGFKRKEKLNSSEVIIPEAMKLLYEKQVRHPLDTTSIATRSGLNTQNANTVRSFVHIESRFDKNFRSHHKFRLKFDISNVPKYEKLKAAELLINREAIDDQAFDDPDDHLQRVLLCDIIKPGLKGKSEPLTRLIDTKVIDTRRTGKLSLDVYEAVLRWLQFPSENYGVLVIVTRMKSGSKRMLHRHLRIRRDENVDELMVWKNKQPFLFIYADDGRNRPKSGMDIAKLRRKRAVRSSLRKNREICKRHAMYVDFESVGWNNWIIAPPGYDAYYCHGECKFPLAQHLNTTNHAIIQTLVNSVQPAQVPKACCVPTSLNMMSMLYLDDENKVVLKNYNEMVVVGCGCR